MVKLREQRITKRTVDRLSVEDRDVVFWDGEPPGFGLRVYPSGGKVYVVQTYLGGKSKRITMGRHGLITADEARRKAAVPSIYSIGSCQRSYARACGCRQRPRRHREELIESERGGQAARRS